VLVPERTVRPARAVPAGAVGAVPPLLGSAWPAPSFAGVAGAVGGVVVCFLDVIEVNYAHES
jgi:hypothetical protein